MFYSLFNYLVTVVAIFVTIYNYGAHNYFITIVMKFRNYFPSSTDNAVIVILNALFRRVLHHFEATGELKNYVLYCEDFVSSLLLNRTDVLADTRLVLWEVRTIN